MGHRVSTPLLEDNCTTIGSQPTMSSLHHRQQQQQQQRQRQQRRRRVYHPHLTVAILFCAATNTIASSTSTQPQSSFAFATTAVPYAEVTKCDVRFRSSKTKHSSMYRPGRTKRSTNRDRWSVVSYAGGHHGGLGDSRRSSKTHNRVGGPLHLTTANSVLPSSPSPVSCFATSEGRERRSSRRRKTHRDKKWKPTKRRISRAAQIHLSRAAQIHCDDALITRIMKGKESTSPRWRQRTRRAAASFGFRLEGSDESFESLRFDSFPEFVETDFDDGCGLDGKSDNGGRHRRKGQRRRRRLDRSLYNVTSPHTLSPEQYDAQRNLWASRYTSLTTLRSTFGTNQNKLWGDFDPSTT